MSAREHQPFGAVREGGCWGDGGAGGFPQRQERQAGKASFLCKLLTRERVPSTERVRQERKPYGPHKEVQLRSGVEGIRRSLVRRDVCVAAVHQTERAASPG